MASTTVPAAQVWETPEVPAHGTAFWNSLPDSSPARNVKRIFTDAEVLALGLDDHARKSTEEKLRFLLQLVEQKLETAEAAAASAPNGLRQTDWSLWVNITAAIFELQHTLNMPEADTTLGKLVSNGKDGGKNYAFVYQLARVKLQRGQYNEAEELAKETLPWMQNHEILGKDSPQALGTHRIILQALAKQGRTDEARAMADATKALIDGMNNGRYSKYQEEEKVELENTVKELSL